MAKFQIINGGVTTAKGFLAAGAHVGLKRKRKDLAIITSVLPCEYGAVFTTNTAKGAPIIWNQEVVASGKPVSAIVINSGNANACTGAPGLLHAREMAATTAACLGIDQHQVLVASTGVIGVPLPIETAKAGICTTAQLLDADAASGLCAAEAIMTTDTFVKQACVQFEIGGKLVTMGAMAKGSGMLHPNMATMLAFICTDMNISSALVQKALSDSVQKTYNMISIDGDTSTNDMVVVLANGLADNAPVTDENSAEYALFCDALSYMNEYLTKCIASDGEGATKLIEVKVSGARTLEDARALAKGVIGSSLVKTAFFGEDANWGRIVAAMGATGIDFDYSKLCIQIMGGMEDAYLLMDGIPCWTDDLECSPIMSEREITLYLELNDGDHQATAWGCDLTPDYARINGNYRRKALIGLTATKEGAA